MIHVKIVTPSGLYHTFEASKIHACTAYGECTLLPNHMPITSVLEIGVTKVNEDKEPVYVTTMGGVMHFKDNAAVILTDIAELGQDIDEVRAKEAYNRAKAKLEAHADKLSVIKAQIALKKAIARISATNKYF